MYKIVAMNKVPKRIYLDYAATTPVDPRVVKAMAPFWSVRYGNPGSLHGFGQLASGAVFKARRTIGEAIGASYREIIFTGSATEANNLALRGAVKAFQKIQKGVVPKIVVSAIEHESILETCADLKEEGVDIVVVPVSRTGIVNLRALAAALDERTVVVSVMYANNEIGSIQPLSQIAAVIREFRVHGSTLYPLFHTDAAQALQYLDCRVISHGAELMTLSGHKIYGPKGIGALYVQGGVRGQGRGFRKNPLNPNRYALNPILTGGEQEEGLRSGTENVPLIAGFARAVEIAGEMRARESVRIARLRDRLKDGIIRLLPAARVNGPEDFSREKRLPNNLNISFLRIQGEELLVRLDLQGIAASQGSACRARGSTPSQVLRAIGLSETRREGAIRFTLGRGTSERDIDTTLQIIKNIITHYV